MKKIFYTFTFVAILISLTACSSGSSNTGLPKGIKWGDSYDSVLKADKMLDEVKLTSDGKNYSAHTYSQSSDGKISLSREGTFLNLPDEISVGITYKFGLDNSLQQVNYGFHTENAEEQQRVIDHYSKLYQVDCSSYTSGNNTVYTWETNTTKASILATAKPVSTYMTIEAVN